MLPQQYRANATAASLPEDSISPYKSSWRDNFSPSLRYIEEPSTPTACLGMDIWSNTLQFSQISKAVIIFVVLAIRLGSVLFLSSSILPLRQSSMAADFADRAPAWTGTSRTAASNAAAVLSNFLFILFTRG